MSTDWIFIGTVYAYRDTTITAERKKRVDLYRNTINGENVYQARVEGQSYFVAKNPYFGTKQCYSYFTHMIMCEDKNYYLNI